MVFFETYSRRQPDRDEIEDEEEEVEDEEDEEEDEAPRVPVEEEDMEEQPPLNIKQYLNFSGEDSQFSDFTFIIGRHHRKFHVEKGILIRHSPILKEMIVDIQTITILDVEETAFQRFLEVIYGASYVLNEDNIEKVLKLVKKWQAPFARRVCEDFVHNCRIMDRIKKLKLCVLYDLNELGLKTQIVRSFVSFEEIMDLRSSTILSGDAEMMRLMFDRVMALRNEARRHEMLVQNNYAQAPRRNPTPPPANPAPRAHIPPPENQENFRENQSSSSNDDIEHGRAPAPPPYQELAQPATPVDFIVIRRDLNSMLSNSERHMRENDYCRAHFWLHNTSDYLKRESEHFLPAERRHCWEQSPSSESSLSTSVTGSEEPDSQNQNRLGLEWVQERLRAYSSLSPSARRQRNGERRVGSRSRSPARSPAP